MSWIAIADYFAENWLEVVGAVTAVVGIWLTTRRSLLCWPIILVSDIACLIVVYRTGLKSDAWLQVFFTAFTLYGWWHWAQGVREEGEVRVVRLPLPSLMAGLTAGAVGGIALGFWMKHLHAALPWLDAQLASYSLVGSWWQARKHIANWWLWIIVDLVYIGEYLHQGLRALALLSAVLVALAMLGLRDWRRAAEFVRG